MFRFRLQRVLELKEQHEQAKARELAAAQEQADAARRTRDDLEAVKTTSQHAIAAAQESAPCIGHLHQFGMVMQSIEQRLAHAGEAVVNAENIVAGAHSALQEAARDRRMLDKLKEKHVGQWRTEEAARDRLQMDEIAIARYARSKAQGTADAPANLNTPRGVPPQADNGHHS